MPSAPRCLTALPVFNEAKHLDAVLDQVVRHADDILVVDDGSTDGSGELLLKRSDIQLVRHETNRGYGAALQTAFRFAIEHQYDVLVTIDCDGQHEPQLIGQLSDAVFASADLRPADIVSGSRYLSPMAPSAGSAPEDRKRINRTITEELNKRLGLSLTDAFCGFKAYRVESLKRLELTEPGYAMPLELWVQAAHHRLEIVELPVPLIYLDEDRSFGGALDESEQRLKYYREVICRACLAAAPVETLCGGAPCDVSTGAPSTSSC